MVHYVHEERRSPAMAEEVEILNYEHGHTSTYRDIDSKVEMNIQ